MNGTKYDAGKPRMSLLSTIWLTGVAKVLGFGAHKYGDHNWRGGFKTSRLIDAALRHLLAWNAGEDKDPESGLSHLYHASCCIMMLCEQMETRPELDDRYRRDEATQQDETPSEVAARMRAEIKHGKEEYERQIDAIAP